MTPTQYRRAEKICEALDTVPSVEDPAGSLVQRIRTHLEGSRIRGGLRVLPDGTYDSRLDDAITLAEALLTNLRLKPPGQERRTTPRYPLSPLVPAVVSHTDLGIGQDMEMADIGLGGLRLMGPTTSRSSLRWSDAVDVRLSPCEETEASNLVGLAMSGVVVRAGSDHFGLSLHIRFDRSEGDWTPIDRWIRRLALRSFENP